LIQKGWIVNSSPAHKTSDERFIADLIQAYAISGGGRPVLPAGRRYDAIALLTGLLAARDRFEDYLSSLEPELEHHGIRLRLLEAPDLAIPDERIAREGFGNLPDENLADIALSPEALQAIREYLDDPEHEVGTWLIEAVLADERSRPPDPEGDERVLRALEAVRGPAPPDEVVATVAGIDDTKPLRTRSRTARWIGGSLSLAASLLLGILLGTQIRTGTEGREVLLGQVSVRGDITRGAQDLALDVTNRGDRRAFITVVGLAPGRRSAAFHYRLGNRYIDVPAHETATVRNLPPEFEGATVAIVVLSDVPAGESVRVSLPTELSPARAGELAEKLRQDLASLNIHARFQTVPLARSKR
jgi:hypothetical protein